MHLLKMSLALLKISVVRLLNLKLINPKGQLNRRNKRNEMSELLLD